MPNRDLANIRNHYQKDALAWDKLASDPMTSLKQWLQEAIDARLYEPTAMTLATVDDQGQPHARIVLLKGMDDGLLFYTNTLSAKGQELASHPNAALVFFWPELERQVRVEGVVSQVSAEQSDAYFHSRPQDSQLAASISQQSQVIADRHVLEDAFAVAKQTAEQQPITRPAHWGGYRLLATRFEFWQGRPNRLHDRLCWQATATGWIQERLAP
jgi:pyridoxamine 5'-phosphate oxidase